MADGREGLFSPINSPTFAYDRIERIEDLLGNPFGLPKFNEKELIQLLDNPPIAADYLEELDHPYFVQLAKRMRRSDGYIVKDFIAENRRTIDFLCMSCRMNLGWPYKFDYSSGYYTIWLCSSCVILRKSYIKVQA